MLVPLHFRIRIAFIIHSLLVITGHCCMPGYEAEREKIRQYLGLEWVSDGLKEMDAKKLKPIRHPEDLNCDFTNPSECKWFNAKDIDSLDFHLFEKEDHTMFPLLQVRPGPSKIEPGDKLIFTGDRKKVDQSAVLMSWPIRCQNNTGKLTFDFWVYNGAMVEAIIYEENMDTAELKQSGEKIYVDCGTVSFNTECSVDIPPRDKPFRIGLRAFDIHNPEGAFAMIDNIYYSASLCKVSIDFGDDFHTDHLMTGAEGMAIEYASQLSCTEFDSTCRWRNGGHGSRIWKKAATQLSEQLMFNETGTFVTPKAPYGFMYIEEGSKMDDFMALISDPIDCQSSSGSTLSFRLWATKGITMSICTVDFAMKPIECQKIAMGRSPAPSVHHFEQSTRFMYSFRVDEANPDFDNFIIIDDISYEATMCNEATNALDFGKNFFTTPMLSTLFNRPVTTAMDLDCSFNKRGIDCLWANSDSENSNWEVGIGTIDKTKFTSLTRRLTTPDGEFGVARLSHKNQSAILISEPIKCMSDHTTLSFRYWHTGAARLAVCIVKSISYEVLDCQVVGPVTNEYVVVEVPHFKETIRLALKADSTFGPGVIAVDNIKLEGKVCQAIAFSSNSGLTIKKPLVNRPVPVAPDANVCRLLSCNFDKGHICLYETNRVAHSLSMFSVRDNAAFTLLFGRSQVSMLESVAFRLNAPARLHFDYSIEKGFAQLFFCSDSASRELDSCYKVTTAKDTKLGKTVHDYIEVLPSDTKIYIIAKLDALSRKASVRVDNLRLLDTENHEIC